jgi:hypothetical protein
MDFAAMSGIGQGLTQGISNVQGLQAVQANQQMEAVNRAKLEEITKEQAHLNTKVDITKFPVFMDRPPESQKKIIDMAKAMNLGQEDGAGGYIMSRREKNEFLTTASRDEAAIENFFGGDKTRAAQNFNAASAEYDKIKKSYDDAMSKSQGPNGVPMDTKLAEKFRVAQAQKLETLKTYQSKVGDLDRGMEAARVNADRFRLEEAGEWGKLPLFVQQAYNTGSEEQVKTAYTAMFKALSGENRQEPTVPLLTQRAQAGDQAAQRTLDAMEKRDIRIAGVKKSQPGAPKTSTAKSGKWKVVGKDASTGSAVVSNDSMPGVFVKDATGKLVPHSGTIIPVVAKPGKTSNPILDKWRAGLGGKPATLNDDVYR